MNHTPLEDQVHDALHRRVAPLQHAPFTVSDVRRRARRVQRRRAAAAGVAVAAVLAIAVPFGLDATGPAQRSEVPPATQPPAPSIASGTVLVDPSSAETLAQTPVPLLDVDAPSLISPDGTTDLPGPFSVLTPYLDGWVGVAMNEGTGTLRFLGADGTVDDGSSPTGGLVASPDGTRVAWSEYTGSQWEVVVADPSGSIEPVRTTFPPAPQEHRVEPVGFVAGDEVVVRTFDDSVDTRTYVLRGGGQPIEVAGLLEADSASAATGLVAGLSRLTADGACSGAVNGAGTPVWETCEHSLGAFSPSGAYVVGTDPEADAYGSPTVSVLDGSTGEEIVTFEAALPRRTVGGFYSQVAWEGDEALVVRLFRGEEYAMMRLGLDSTVRRIDIDSAGASGLTVAQPW
ncbi:hypothetical protein CFI00_04775 [Nocardioides sp. S5]|uniref:hypothetical protein n=1 Tax=Nocardioides sp. S5 TaxID=2017486 RepID=UPI001A8FF331|nr:hypothetical protein [Nocardioides sp. S5]QSR29830.1 hypothetical protein CFI00_04775 [Nocardioides sp. S5]